MEDAKGTKFVVRKKPPGTLISKQAHQVEREYRIITALFGNSDFPVPKTHGLCEDESIIGSPFFVMSFVSGRIFSSPYLPTVPFGERRAFYYEMMDRMAHLHSIDIKKVGDFEHDDACLCIFVAATDVVLCLIIYLTIHGKY